MSGQHSSPVGALVLLVEDHDDTRDMYGDYLRFSGFRVVSVTAAEQAIKVALAEHPAVIVMDVGLPGMTGTAPNGRTLEGEVKGTSVRIEQIVPTLGRRPRLSEILLKSGLAGTATGINGEKNTWTAERGPSLEGYKPRTHLQSSDVP